MSFQYEVFLWGKMWRILICEGLLCFGHVIFLCLFQCPLCPFVINLRLVFHCRSFERRLIDGIVFARSIFHHSMNYRSAVLFGKGRVINNYDEKWNVFKALTEHIAKGRWDDARKPTEQETNVTTIVAIDIESASAKVRTGPANDDEEDYALPIWAGVMPVQLQFGEPINDERLANDIGVLNYIKQYER